MNEQVNTTHLSDCDDWDLIGSHFVCCGGKRVNQYRKCPQCGTPGALYTEASQ